MFAASGQMHLVTRAESPSEESSPRDHHVVVPTIIAQWRPQGLASDHTELHEMVHVRVSFVVSLLRGL